MIAEINLLSQKIKQLQETDGRRYVYKKEGFDFYTNGGFMGMELVDGVLKFEEGAEFGLVFMNIIETNIYKFTRLKIDTNSSNIVVNIRDGEDNNYIFSGKDIDLTGINDTFIDITLELFPEDIGVEIKGLVIEGIY